MALRKHAWFAGAVALTLVTAGCGSDSSSSSADGSSGAKEKGTITLGFIPSWTDGLSTAYLLQNQLEKEGYTVKMQTLTEPAPLYAGLAKGDVDIYPSAWPEVTHKSYMDKYGKDIEDLGAYYDDAKLTMAVPTYSKINSIADLPANASEFGGKVIGIEAGAGLTKAVKEKVFPEYKLSGKYQLVTSSTPAMLTQLKNATGKKEDIVVTLWRPFWANSKFPVKDLKDPKGALGKPESLHFLATKGFKEKNPEAAKLIAGIKLDDKEYGSLEDEVVNKFGKGKEAEAVTAWLKANPDAYDTEVK